ncbi:hypothetical protein COHA_008993 [Chlorella ohadii]|uniref:Uncharacterized protein n=1 Tax=Chlorella ohadii TaxID=2649997 RepID=A0AAD5H2Q7_9CHLO|nr:hypothetical protein COHA_008993 [Chlorella ohadii]
MGWFEWLVELLDLQPPRPTPGTEAARLEEMRVAALLDKEVAKPAGQRDEELEWGLRLEVHKTRLANAEAYAARAAQLAAWAKQPATQQCCAAAGWVRQRAAASYEAQHGYYSLIVVQSTEEVAAAQARRRAVIVAEPMLRLELSGELQQAPPRMDTCSECAQLLQEVELAEGSSQACIDVTLKKFQEWGMKKAAPGDAAASGGPAAAAAAKPARGAEGGPVTPKQQPQQEQQQQQHPSSDEELPQQHQQHPSTDQEQEQRQEWGAADT